MTTVTNLVATVAQITAPGQDTIHAIFTDFRPGAGQIVITTYEYAFACWFNAIGKDRKIRQFFLDCHTDYLENKLSPPRASKRQLSQLRQAIGLVKPAIQEEPCAP